MDAATRKNRLCSLQVLCLQLSVAHWCHRGALTAPRPVASSGHLPSQSCQTVHTYKLRDALGGGPDSSRNRAVCPAHISCDGVIFVELVYSSAECSWWCPATRCLDPVPKWGLRGIVSFHRH
jgi:hypothetical protein